MKQPDWEAIERAYRAGSLSIRAIADRYSTSESTIRSRAKKHGWQRDLTEQVRAATKSKLSRTNVAHTQVREDAQIVDEASDEAAIIVLSHRSDLAQWRKIANKLCAALSGMAVTEANHNDFARSLNAGVDAQLKVIKGERQAFNIDAEEGNNTVESLSSLMDDLAAEA